MSPAIDGRRWRRPVAWVVSSPDRQEPASGVTARGTEGNRFYGLAIGFAVLAGVMAAGPVSGGAFNPALGIGTIAVDAVMGGSSFGALWLYLVGPLAGGVVAAAVFKMQNPEDV